MTRILHIDASSESAENSYSRRVSAELVASLARAHPGAEVTYRDVAADPPPHIDGALRAGWTAMVDQRSPVQVEIVTRSEGYIAELKAADLIVIGCPCITSPCRRR